MFGLMALGQLLIDVSNRVQNPTACPKKVGAAMQESGVKQWPLTLIPQIRPSAGAAMAKKLLTGRLTSKGTACTVQGTQCSHRRRQSKQALIGLCKDIGNRILQHGR